ncbi:hypothetical protein QA601_00520 [Chitinispirillales bacterium ANBcel5]|uniref:hypothetical protein n=1 Tax=Cellulosispirillum alkaliphilum TaxID=3039283 RepID=UPI002A50A4D0|nr:hypothetical protein [Chitinispirillales bacterium ANBcel5]
MKKNAYIEEKRRHDVVSSMAKKLATPDQTMVFSEAKKRSHKLTLIASSVVFIVIMIVVGVTYTLKGSTGGPEGVSVQVNSPVQKITDVYHREEISVEQYSMLLTDVLVRYDSLPEHYRVEAPLIDPEEIYQKLARVWPLVDVEIRNTILKDIPQLESRL